jgi:Flp pilus assembly protein TadG
MRDTQSVALPSHARRAALRRIARRRALARLRARKGQSIIIFALTLTVLLGFAGLAIDVARIYDLYARMQRAAESGALAGVLYMPNNYNTARPGDSFSAISRALAETYKNGFGPPPVVAPDTAACPTPFTATEVSVCQIPGKTNDLRVAITETTSLSLLSALGLRPVTLTVSAQAEYLPPVQLGSRLNYFGDEVECSATNPPDPLNTTACPFNSGSNHIQSFLATFKGPAENKERGDPYVFCEEGPSFVNSAADLDGSNTGAFTLYNNEKSNHPQWGELTPSATPPPLSVVAQHCGLPVAGGNPGNPDQQPDGFAGPATTGTNHVGGYNYEISVPSSVSTASIWIYNPSFIPTDDPAGTDTFDFYTGTGGYFDPLGGGVGTYNGHQDAPPFYFSVTYTIYHVTDLFDRSTDSQVTSVTYPPYDYFHVSANPSGRKAPADNQSDTALHGCLAGQAYDPYWLDYKDNSVNSTVNSYHLPGSINSNGSSQGCYSLNSATPPSWHTTAPLPCFQQWCSLALNLSSGFYRLVVEATGLASNVAEYHSGKTDGWGKHSYAVKVCPTSAIANPIGNNCPSGATSTTPGVALFGWNNMEATFSTALVPLTPSSTDPTTSCAQTNASAYACLDLGCIQTAYAGRQLDIRLFDLGDGSGNLFAGITPPPGSAATVSYPGFLTTSTIDGAQVVQTHFTSPNAFNPLNGRWLDVSVTLPPSYTGNCLTSASGTGWWQLIYATDATNGQPGDWLNVSFSLVGSPVHLVTPALT